MSLTLSVLDDALFSLSGVVDFKADLATCQDRDCLTLTLSLSPEADPDAVVAAAQEKLAEIPVIRWKQLAVELPQPGIFGLLTPGNQKRTLADHRPKSNRRYSD